MKVPPAAEPAIHPELPMSEAAEAIEPQDQPNTVGAREAFDTVVEESLRDLMEQYGAQVVNLEPIDPPAPRDAERLAGVIGFVAADFAGTLVIETTNDVVRESLPTIVDDEKSHESAYRDWIGELSNQLLGRTKNRLLRYGVSFHMSPPTTLTGTRLNLTPTGARTMQWLRVTLGTGTMDLMVDLRCASDLRFTEDDSADSAQDEGDLVLF